MGVTHCAESASGAIALPPGASEVHLLVELFKQATHKYVCLLIYLPTSSREGRQQHTYS